MFFLCNCLYFLKPFVVFNAVFKVVFTHICSINHRLVCQQRNRCQQFRFFFSTRNTACGFSLIQCFFYTLEKVILCLIFFICFHKFLCFFNTSVQNLHVGQNQFHIDGFYVSGRANAALYMDNVIIFKAAYHMYNRVHFTNIGQKFVAQSFPFGSASHQTCNIHKLNGSRQNFLRMIHLSQHI